MSIENVIIGIRELEDERTKYKKQVEDVKKYLLKPARSSDSSLTICRGVLSILGVKNE